MVFLGFARSVHGFVKLVERYVAESFKEAGFGLKIVFLCCFCWFGWSWWCSVLLWMVLVMK